MVVNLLAVYGGLSNAHPKTYILSGHSTPVFLSDARRVFGFSGTPAIGKSLTNGGGLVTSGVKPSTIEEQCKGLFFSNRMVE